MTTAERNDGSRQAKGGRIKSGGTRRARSEQTELLLLRTALRLFAERGFHGTGIRDIAVAAEVSVSAMYYYASSKDELLESVMRRTLGVLTTGATETVAESDEPGERLVALISLHVAFHARNPQAAGVVDQEFGVLTGQAREEILSLRDAYEQIWASTLRDGVDQGIFLDRGSLGRLAILEMTTGVAHWYRPDGPMSVPQLCDRFADMGLALMGAARDGRGLTVADFRRPDPELLSRRTELVIEPRDTPEPP
jgi:AcrR family transcriptional regulator